MIRVDEALTGRDALLGAAGHHPYARHALRRDEAARGWRHAGAVGWLLLRASGRPAARSAHPARRSTSSPPTGRTGRCGPVSRSTCPTPIRTRWPRDCRWPG
ncbi:hypothetical protein V2I01_29010 [Micromonospora sp. BRA006-A]|nr:hypothetical protein [Micromonospora sp. BRA006-A]